MLLYVVTTIHIKEVFQLSDGYNYLLKDNATYYISCITSPNENDQTSIGFLIINLKTNCMKKFFYSVLAAATMLFATTSCSSEEEIVSGGTTGNGNTQKVKFSVQLPDQTESRTIAGGYNVGKGEMADKLIWALYESTKTDEDPVMTGVGEKVNGEKAFTADIDMVKGLEYKILFLAYKNFSKFQSSNIFCHDI
jgi:hypothetical protein